MCRRHVDSCFREQPQQEQGGREEAVLGTLHQGYHLDMDHPNDDQPNLLFDLVKKNNSMVDRILEEHYQQNSSSFFYGRFSSASKVTSLTISISLSSSITNCSVDGFLLPAGSQMHYQLIRYDPDDWLHPVETVSPFLLVLLIRYNSAIGCLLHHERHHGRIDPWTTLFSNAGDDDDSNWWLSRGCVTLVDCRNSLLNDNDDNRIVKDLWDSIIRNDPANDNDDNRAIFRQVCIPLLIGVLKTLGQVWFRLGHDQPAHDCMESLVALKWLVRELEWEQQQEQQHQHYQEPAHKPPAKQQHPVEPQNVPDFESTLSFYGNNNNCNAPAIYSHPSRRY